MRDPKIIVLEHVMNHRGQGVLEIHRTLDNDKIEKHNRLALDTVKDALKDLQEREAITGYIIPKEQQRKGEKKPIFATEKAAEVLVSLKKQRQLKDELRTNEPKKVYVDRAKMKDALVKETPELLDPTRIYSGFLRYAPGFWTKDKSTAYILKSVAEVYGNVAADDFCDRHQIFILSEDQLDLTSEEIELARKLIAKVQARRAKALKTQEELERMSSFSIMLSYSPPQDNTDERKEKLEEGRKEKRLPTFRNWLLKIKGMTVERETWDNFEKAMHEKGNAEGMELDSLFKEYEEKEMKATEAVFKYYLAVRQSIVN